LINNDETFDIIFVDADKEGYPEYFEKSLKVIKKNGIIAVDNVFFHGEVLDSTNNRPMPAAMRVVNDLIYKNDTVFASVLTVGDGITLVLKN
ncbi:unnamed protein product, partial [Ixodes hexagonus]